MKKNDGKALMGNNASRKYVDVEMAKLKLNDGSMWSPWNMRHVSLLKKHLISLGTLDENEHSYTSSGGVNKITDRSSVMMKDEEHLYHLLENTIFVGSAI